MGAAVTLLVIVGLGYFGHTAVWAFGLIDGGDQVDGSRKSDGNR
jgi:hypothetical protein